MFGLSKYKSQSVSDILNTTLFTWPEHSSDRFTIGQSFEGTIITGMTGSGKTSSSGRMMAMTMLKQGYGGVVLCAKPSEAEMWKGYIEKAGRKDDMVIFNRESGLEFNPILYEQKRLGKGAGDTLNIVNQIMSLDILARNFMAGSGVGHGERFWDHAVNRACTRLIDLLKLSDHDLTIMNMREILVNAFTPETIKPYQDAHKILDDEKLEEADYKIALESLQKMGETNFCLKCLVDLSVKEDSLSQSDQEANKLVKSFFLKEFAFLSERTKSVIVESFLGLIQPFESGLLRDQFSKGISDELWPENTFEEGKIIILDFSIKEHLISGLYAQGIYKYIYQQALERRNVKEEENPRPCFLFVDEAHLFANPSYDALFQSTARSSFVATVLLTQGINSYYATMGSDQAKTKSLLMNLNTKIFHASNDYDTNVYGSDLIGEEWKVMASIDAMPSNIGQAHLSEALHKKVLPHEFVTLQKGGDSTTGYKAEAIVVGQKWNNKNTYIRCKFAQNG